MSGLLGPKAQSTVDKRLNGMEINQSAYGSPIALTYGMTRVPMTLGWYGDFTATSHTTKQPGGKGGGKSGTNTTFTYSAAVLMLLGEGQVNGVGTVWNDKAQVTLADLGLTLFSGAGAQTPWSYLTTNHPSEAIGYDHTAYVANGSFQLGGSAALPNLTFELKGLQQYNPGVINDAEPSDILIDYCTDPNHGAGFPYLGTLQGVGNTYESYCIAMGMFISPSERTQRAAADFVAEILKVTNSECVWSAGVLKVMPLADAAVTGNGRSFTPDLTPKFTFTDDDYIYEPDEDPVRVTRKAPAERFNIIRVEYTDRSNQYNTDIAEAKDSNDIILNGERPAPTITLRCIQTRSLARQVAQIILQRQLFVVNSYEFKVRADFSLLEPLDYVAIYDAGQGLSNQLVRITETDDSEEDEFTITAEEVLVGVASAPLYNWQAAAGYAANYSASPGSVSTPLIFNAPPLLVGFGGGYELWLAVSGANALWGGCDVYMSLDNSSYGYVGTIAGPARHGTLTATLASGAALDTVNTLAVQLARTELALGSGTTTDRDENRLLMYVDGEIISYQTATLAGAGAYNITSLRRGQYGSGITSHASATKFARIDAALFRVPYDPGMIGKTAYFKFVSFNVYGGGYETLAGVTAYSKVLTAVNIGQAIPGTVTLTGRGVTVVGDKAFKSAATSAWDSDVYASNGYKNGAFVSWRVPSLASAEVIVGLNSDPVTNSSYTSIDYGLVCRVNGDLDVYESGTGVGTVGTFAPGDDLSVTYDGSIVRYVKNGVALLERMAGPGLILRMDSSFYYPLSSIEDIRIGSYGTAQPVMFNARGNCVVSDTHIGKVGGASAWDSDVYSLMGYQTCHVSFKGNSAPTEVMVGLSTTPLSSLSYSGVNYAWHLEGDGDLNIYESGSLIGTYGTYTTKTVLAITYDGSTVTYWKDGVSIRTVSISGLTLYMDSSFYSPGVGINSLRFGPTTNLDMIDTSQIGLNAATEVYQVANLTQSSYGNGTHYAISGTFTPTSDGSLELEIVYDYLGKAEDSLGNDMVRTAFVLQNSAYQFGVGAMNGDGAAWQSQSHSDFFTVVAGSLVTFGLLLDNASGTENMIIRNARTKAGFIKR